jgi:Tol biopolymer transport system component
LALAVTASVGLVVVVCIGLIAALLIVGVGFGRQAAERQVDMVDRIAFLGSDGNLYLMDREGGNVSSLAVGGEGMALNYPTWSPDGRRVAFIAQRQAATGIESILYTVSTVGGEPTTLYSSSDNPPFYLYWSPDSQRVGFLTQEDASLALRLAPADGGQTARVLERGSPFYWSWSPDGRELFVHIGGARRLSQEARLAILAEEPESVPDVLEDAPANFQAPAWSPDGNRLLYAGEGDAGEQALYVRPRESGAAEKLVDVTGVVRFNWSPDGQWIAYHQIDDPNMSPLGQVFVVPAPGTQTGAGGVASEARRVSRDPALAFFWSPDGQHLAILTPALKEDEPSARQAGLAAPVAQEVKLLFRWWLVDMPDGEPHPLVTFQPTASFLFIVPYFDQYAQSMRFWSPDSRYLVYSKQETAQQAGIWVANVEGQEPARRLADGVLAVWSWQ